jgi:hypothetical protein
LAATSSAPAGYCRFILECFRCLWCRSPRLP